MTTIVGIRDLARNIDILQKYDYVDIEDKKTSNTKGFFSLRMPKSSKSIWKINPKKKRR